tara:strand:- start:1068 stop:2150 length:1083 start_codon:yes stop_codon:yes gene_type:complete
MKLIYLSNFNEMSGFSEAARGYLSCLKDDVEVFNLVIENNNQHAIENTINSVPKEEYGVIWHANPLAMMNVINGRFDSINGKLARDILVNSSKNVNITAWETSEINPHFLEVYDKFKTKAVLVPSEYNKSCFSKHIRTECIQHVVGTGPSLPYLSNMLSDKKFFLSISQWNYRKNFKDLIYCFYKEFFHEEVYLVIKSYVSHHNPGSTEIASSISKVRSLFDSNNNLAKCKVVLLTDYIKSEEKNYLLKNCVSYVGTSLSEGFGLSYAEAAAFNKPVVASNSTGQIDFLNSEFLFDTYEDYYQGPLGYGYTDKMTVHYPIKKSVCEKMRKAYENSDPINHNLHSREKIKNQFLDFFKEIF